MKKEWNEQTINQELEKQGKFSHEARVLLAYRIKYNSPKKREARREELINQWLQREQAKGNC